MCCVIFSADNNISVFYFKRLKNCIVYALSDLAVCSVKDCETVSLSVLRRQDATSRGIKLFSTFIAAAAAAANTQTTNCQLVDERQQQQQEL